MDLLVTLTTVPDGVMPPLKDRNRLRTMARVPTGVITPDHRRFSTLRTRVPDIAMEPEGATNCLGTRTPVGVMPPDILKARAHTTVPVGVKDPA